MPRPGIRPPPKRHSRWVRRAALAVSCLAVLLLAVILTFNGQRIHDPLIAFVHEQTGLELEFEDAEFSPLYPNTLRLRNVTFNHIRADDVYLEFDLLGALLSNYLHIYDLYLSKVRYQEAHLHQISLQLEHYPQLQIDQLRIEHSDLELFGFATHNTSLELRDLGFREGGLYPRSGSISVSEVTSTPHAYAGYQLRSLLCVFRFREPGFELLELEQLSLRGLGGTLTASGIYSIPERTLSLNEVYINRMALRSAAPILPEISVIARRAELTETGLFDEQFTLAQVSGTLEELSYAQGQLSFDSFQGQVGEITDLPSGLMLSDGLFTLAVSAQAVHFELQASMLGGHAYIRGRRELDTARLVINELRFDGVHLELRQALLDRLRGSGLLSDTRIAAMEIRGLRVLSELEDYPFAADSIDVTSDGLSLCGAQACQDHASTLHIQASGVLYHDIRVQHGAARISLSPAAVRIDLPQLEFRNSSLSAELVLSRENGVNALRARADDFDLSSLNSSVLGHFFAGKLSFEIDLHSQGAGWTDNLQGHATLRSAELLVSALGLDLINGGDLQPHTLSCEELYAALRQGDAGIYNLQLAGVAKERAAKLEGSFDLASARVRTNLSLNLDNLQLGGRVALESPARDSQTLIHFTGAYPAVRIIISPVRRGHRRLGLFDKPVPSRGSGQDAATLLDGQSAPDAS